MSKKGGKRYVFSLLGVNINKVDQKYSIVPSIQEEETIPDNATKIDDLDIIKKTPDIVSFLDESKQIRKCTVSMIDFQTEKKLGAKIRYKCFWDRNYIPDNVSPIGCPIRYIPNKAVKTYISEISKEKYTIRENVTDKKSIELRDNGDSRLSVESYNYYQTDGIFCSFNCCMAYIQSSENKNNPIYRYSESLLLKMYNSFNPEEETIEIVSAPHWRTLVEFGGNLSIEQFRESFNKVSYIDHGIYCVSIGRLFEDKIKF